MASLSKSISVTNGNFDALPNKVKNFVLERSELCQPDYLHICDGSEEESKKLADLLVKSGMAQKLEKMDNWSVSTSCLNYYFQRQKCSTVTSDFHFFHFSKTYNFFFSYAVRTNPADVARVESKTLICTEEKFETIPHTKEGVEGRIGKWAEPKAMREKLNNLFKGCMKGLIDVF